MDLVPRLLGIALVGFVLGGSTAAFAGDTAAVDTAAALPDLSQDLLLPVDAKSSVAPQPQFDRQSGQVDFFSVRPEAKSGDFTSLLGSSTGGGGLQLHFNW